jgi:hypothetical protein
MDNKETYQEVNMDEYAYVRIEKMGFSSHVEITKGIQFPRKRGDCYDYRQGRPKLSGRKRNNSTKIHLYDITFTNTYAMS